jgi:hypothetical protein
VYGRNVNFNFDQVAKKIGDDIRLYWISEVDVPLEKSTIERYLIADNTWIDVERGSIVF